MLEIAVSEKADDPVKQHLCRTWLDDALWIMAAYVKGNQEGFPDAGYAWSRSLRLLRASLNPRQALRQIVWEATAQVWRELGGSPLREPPMFKTLPDDQRVILAGFFGQQAA